MTFNKASRREFLRTAAAFGLVSGVATPLTMNLASITASAQTSSEYKALVCVFLFGGCDHYNTVVPFDAASHAAYRQARPNLALERDTLVPLTSISNQNGRQIALPPALSSSLKPLYDAQRLAIVSNVGPLIQPVSKAQIDAGTAILPPSLQSHNDQQSLWQSGNPEGSRDGYGGRIANLLGEMNSKANFTCVGTSGFSLFLSGKEYGQLQIQATGDLLPYKAVRNLEQSSQSIFGSKMGADNMRAILTSPEANLFEREYARTAANQLSAERDLEAAIAPNDSLPPLPDTNNGLTAQLRGVARAIAGNAALGVSRQIFFVGIGGWDTHDNQRGTQPGLQTYLGSGIRYFDELMGLLNLRNQVTLFTMSDFGRTLTDNGDGTDHGWGGHHFVSGGAVKGGDVYGQLPVIGINNDNHRGKVLIPTVASDQYVATLAQWFGVENGDMNDIFINLKNFDQRNLGFMV